MSEFADTYHVVTAVPPGGTAPQQLLLAGMGLAPKLMNSQHSMKWYHVNIWRECPINQQIQCSPNLHNVRAGATRLKNEIPGFALIIRQNPRPHE